MAPERTMIDIDDRPELNRLVEEVRNGKTSVVLREAGQAIAVVHPLPTGTPQPGSGVSAADVETFRAAAGGWQGYVDADRFLADNEESRRNSTRPAVDL